MLEYFDCSAYQVDRSDVLTLTTQTLLDRLNLQLQLNSRNPKLEVTLVINFLADNLTGLSMYSDIVASCADFEVWQSAMQGTDMDRLNQIPMSVFTQLDLPRCAWVFKGGG